MARNKNIKVALHDNEYDFIKWLAKRDGVTISEELRNLFYTQLQEEMDLYDEERRQEMQAADVINDIFTNGGKYKIIRIGKAEQ